MSTFEDAMNMMSLEPVAPNAGGEGFKKAPTNRTHFVNLLARVYSKVAAIYDAERKYDFENDIKSIIEENNLFSLCSKSGKVADCDVVSIIEAVRWSLTYLESGLRYELRPVEVVDTSWSESPLGREIYNAFLCDYDGVDSVEFYEEYSKYNPGQVLRIVHVSPERITASFVEEG